ncbi:MAG: hypothetical protein GEU94_13055 [Micromonosporaceae bacterium]|nr:hypothetical protein [Micromonosporaceae bacterium]
MSEHASAPHGLLLPAAARLVHIGPHKTGTTALQSAFHVGREQLAEHGVTYAGNEQHVVRAALAVTGQPHMLGEGEPQQRHWERLVADVKAAGDNRVAVTSEFYSEADDDAVRRVIEELGGPLVHIVVTLRPLAKIVPSQWQQWVQNGLREPYEKWLDSTLNQPPKTRQRRKFWQRHDHGQLVERWTAIAGKDNLTVVVVDENDGRMLLRTFEAMLGLPDGLLAPEKAQANRSLTLAETEIVRQFNKEFRRQPWSDRVYARYLRRGAVMQMKAARLPAPDEPKIVTPPWALKRAAEIGAESASQIQALGARIVGDIDSLGALPPDRAEATAAPELALEPAAEAAAEAVVGAIMASGDADPEAQPIEDRRVRHVPSTALMSVVLRRVARRFRKLRRALLRRSA